MTALLVAVLLLLGNAFFVAAEFSLIATRRSQIEPLARDGGRRARTTLGAIDHLSLMMAGAQLGITVCSLGLGAAAEPAVAHLADGPLEAAGLPHGLVEPVAFLIALAIVVFLHMLIGEMVPKNLALAAPERAALTFAPPLAWLVRALGPVITGLNALANGTLRLFGVRPSESVGSAFTHEEVAALVAESRGAGLLDEEDHTLLAAALSLEDRAVADVLTPVSALVTIPRTATTADIQRLVAATGHSRFPLRGEAAGRLAGYVHIGDLIDLLESPDPVPLPAARVRPLPTVRADALLGEVLSHLRATGGQLAEVRDASGATLGMLFFSDVLGALVGRR